MSNKAITILVNYLQKSRGFDQCLRKLNMLSIEDGKYLAKIKVEDQHCNSKGTIHDGFLALLIDVGSVGSTFCEKWNYTPGFTVNLDIKYLQTVKIDDEIIIDANAFKIGKNIAFIETFLKNPQGDVIALGSTVTKSVKRTDLDIL